MPQVNIVTYVGNTQDALAVTAQRTSGAPTDLTSAVITVLFSSGPNRFVGTGAVGVTDAVNGKFTYTFSNTDVATAGDYQLQFIATYSGKPRAYIPIDLRILPLL